MPEPYEGIQHADRQAVRWLAEATAAKNAAADAVRRHPVLGRLMAERSPELADVIPDVVQVVVGELVPAIADQYEADLAKLREALRVAHEALGRLVMSSESQVDKLTEQRDRAVKEAERTAEIKHAQWEVAQRLRGALAVAKSQVDYEKGWRVAELGATATLLRNAAAEAVKHGDQYTADRLLSAAEDHGSEGCALPLAECHAVALAFEQLAEYRARDATTAQGSVLCGGCMQGECVCADLNDRAVSQ